MLGKKKKQKQKTSEKTRGSYRCREQRNREEPTKTTKKMEVEKIESRRNVRLQKLVEEKETERAAVHVHGRRRREGGSKRAKAKCIGAS